MVSVALLWEWEATDLLNAMIDGQMNAILIKVASYGLTKDHLGKSLSQLKTHLLGL
jgi:diphthine-ammonia ligase